MCRTEVRIAEEKDISAIAEMEKICFTTPWSEDSIRQELTQNENALYVVAEEAGQPIGYAGLWQIMDEGHITNVAVLPAWRKWKIGTLILSAMLHLGEERGICSFTLEVRSSNEAARRLYQNFGFKEAGLRRGYYQDNGEDALIMWRNRSD